MPRLVKQNKCRQMSNYDKKPSKTLCSVTFPYSEESVYFSHSLNEVDDNSGIMYNDFEIEEKAFTEFVAHVENGKKKIVGEINATPVLNENGEVVNIVLSAYAEYI